MLCYLVYVTYPLGGPLYRFSIDEYEYPYYIIGIFCLLLVCTFFALLSTYRLFLKKEEENRTKATLLREKQKIRSVLVLYLHLLHIIGCCWFNSLLDHICYLYFLSLSYLFLVVCLEQKNHHQLCCFGPSTHKHPPSFHISFRCRGGADSDSFVFRCGRGAQHTKNGKINQTN